jgi:hypothetical protein
MRSRMALADILRRTGTLDGVSESYDHMRDMLRLFRGDNLDMRDTVPYMMLQLDMDQAAYDFVKWWLTIVPDGKYDWGDFSQPFLDIKNADVLEDVKTFHQAHGRLAQVTAILLSKLKLLIDLINMMLVRKVVGSRLPPELWQRIEAQVGRSPIAQSWAGQPYQSLMDTQQILKTHIKFLAEECLDMNPDLVFNILDAEGHFGTISPYSAIGFATGAPTAASPLLPCLVAARGRTAASRSCRGHYYDRF